MDILIIDKNEISAQLLKAKLEKLNYDVALTTSTKDALTEVQNNDFTTILLNPEPLPVSKVEPIIIDIRRACRKYIHIILLSGEVDQITAIRTGANDCMDKVVNQDDILKHLGDSHRLLELRQRIGDVSEDFPSAGGVIAKSAFNQLFTAAIDRAGRYGEKTYVLFVSLSNYKEIFKNHGKYTANMMAASFSQLLASVRRQSDIVGQTADFEYAILLQRPNKKNEPEQAAQRFANTLKSLLVFDSSLGIEANMRVELVELPTGQQISNFEWTVTPSKIEKPA